MIVFDGDKKMGRLLSTEFNGVAMFIVIGKDKIVRQVQNSKNVKIYDKYNYSCI